MNDQDILIENAKIIAQQRLLIEVIEDTNRVSMSALNAKYKENGETKETYINSQRFKMALPMYYRNKIYTEEEREKLWLEKLDKEETPAAGDDSDPAKE